VSLQYRLLRQILATFAKPTDLSNSFLWGYTTRSPARRIPTMVHYPRLTISVKLTVHSTSASIIPAYRIKGSLGEKVDYVFHFDPKKNSCQPETVDAINTWRAALTDSSINHTPYAPLRHFPILVSIETKPGGMSTRKAQLQTGIWHAAQWRHLCKLAGANLKALPFIPAIE
jgi:hypothetical protein